MSRKKKRAEKHKKNEITKGIFSVLEKNPNESLTINKLLPNSE